MQYLIPQTLVNKNQGFINEPLIKTALYHSFLIFNNEIVDSVKFAFWRFFFWLKTQNKR